MAFRPVRKPQPADPEPGMRAEVSPRGYREEQGNACDHRDIRDSLKYFTGLS